jgi:hypothetical protein
MPIAKISSYVYRNLYGMVLLLQVSKSMKKTTVILLAALILPFATVNAASPGGQGQFMKYMAYANPVPNYVSYIKKNSKALNLSKEQMDQVMAWNKENGPKMHDMVMSILETEKKMVEASMSGDGADEIMNMAKEVSKTRLDIIAGKTRCRDRMLEILNEDQWKQLTAMVKAK